MDAKKFGAFISERRKEQHMTQAGLAGKIGVTDKAVSRWERGLGFPDINTMEPLATALGVSLLELMKSEIISEEVQMKKDESSEKKYNICRSDRDDVLNGRNTKTDSNGRIK